jgi:sulfite exporter TauE/SafE
MCDPIVESLSLGLACQLPWIPHLLYNTGLIMTDTVLGGIMGATDPLPW